MSAMGVISLPIVIAREGKWFVAECPPLDIASQGKTEAEAKSNIKALIKEYMRDPDTRKPGIKQLLSVSLTRISIEV